MKRLPHILSVATVLVASSIQVACAKSTPEAGPRFGRTPGAEFVAVKPDGDFPLPKIVLQYDPATKTGYDWEKLKDLTYFQLTVENAPVIMPLRYLREAVQRMTGKEIDVVSQDDLSTGIVITTLAGAPPELKYDPEVIQALRNNGQDSYNANEAYFIRSEPRRVVIVTNKAEGFGNAIVELLESVDYEALGMGPNWTYVPDYTKRPLVFALERAGRAGFYIRQFGARAGQGAGFGTLFLKPLSDPADETVEISYWRWLVGARMATVSMPSFPGHALQNYHSDVIDNIRKTGNTAGFLTQVDIGPDAQRPPATEENAWALWINNDAAQQPNAGRVHLSHQNKWNVSTNKTVPAALDLSVPMVREIILQDMKKKAQAHFEKTPDEIFVFATDPEDGGGYGRIKEYLHGKNWYPEYLKQKGVTFGQPYVLHGFKGLQQPREIWDPGAPADTVFGFNNWLLREFDEWIDSLPEDERLTSTGKSKKAMVRASLYSYNAHDVPANFNLDTRIRVMIAGFPVHRGREKWRNYASQLDMAQAFQKQLPREPSGDYWLLSLALYHDGTTAAIANSSKLAATLQRRIEEQYQAGFRAIKAEVDFNQGRLGLDYYLYSKLLWDPKLTVIELDAIRDRWLQRAYDEGWYEMKDYYDFMAPTNFKLNAPNAWAKAIRMIDAADKKIEDGSNAQKRLDDLKQFWYFYYLLESGQGKSDVPAMREFVWKGQMSYMTAMYMVAENIFKTRDVRAAAGPEYNTGPAHYTHEETQAWWQKVLDFWELIPVTEFSEATLADGTSGKNVDLNDLVQVKEFQSEKPDDIYFYYESQAYQASALTVASKAGEEIGFKLVWHGKPKDVGYGVARWDAELKRWDTLVDVTTTHPSTPFIKHDGFEFQLVEVRYAAPAAGTYRFDIDYGGGTGTKLTSLAYDETIDKFNGALPFSYSTLAVGYTQSAAYIYIPKGTKSLDLAVWGPSKDRKLRLHTGLPGDELKLSRNVDVSASGTHRVALEPGEDGSIALIYGELFNMPQLYSVPMLWAKSPDALLVPRVIAKSDGLNVVSP